MKKCPNCGKTFDDALKFCQADGTPLVADEPAPDPYATMVGTPADFQIPTADESSDESPGDDAPDEGGAPSVAESSEDREPAAAPEPAADDVLEVPEEEEIDPMKTMVAGGDTSANVKVDIPEPEEAPEPEPPQFEEPDVPQPDMSAASEESAPEPEADSETADAPPPSPFDAGGDSAEPEDDDEQAAPIPSPFDKSMPPGYAPPSTPPFDPSEPVKAEKVASADDAAEPETAPEPPAPEPEAPQSTEDFDQPAAPMEQWEEKQVDEGASFEAPQDGAQAQNQTLAIVSLACGILSMLCCVSILTGPAAVITGFMARSKIAEDPEQYGGGVLAIVGMITGVVGIFLFIVLMILQILPAFL